MSTSSHIVRGPRAAMRGPSANDNAPAETVVAEAGTRTAAGAVVRLWADRQRGRIERHQQPEPPHDYDDVLAIVCAEMGQPSA